MKKVSFSVLVLLGEISATQLSAEGFLQSEFIEGDFDDNEFFEEDYTGELKKYKTFEREEPKAKPVLQ